jgi:hypothetical protein
LRPALAASLGHKQEIARFTVALEAVDHGLKGASGGPAAR